MKVSIIVATYNRAEMVLERAVRSLLAQTYRDWECIIVDDCSTDHTTEKIYSAGLDARFKYLRNEKNLGAAGTKNRGIKEARGEYILILDDDNEIFSTFLEETIPILDEASPEVGAVTVGRIIEYAGFQDYAPPADGSTFHSIDWGWLMRKEVWDKIGYDENMYADEDADLGIQFHKYFKVIPINKPLEVAYDSTKPEDSVCFPTERRLQGLERYIKKNIGEYTDKNELRFLYRLAGRNFYRGGYRLKGLKYFWLSFLARKNWKTFKHFLFILFGWTIYDLYMDYEERKGSELRLIQNNI